MLLCVIFRTLNYVSVYYCHKVKHIPFDKTTITKADYRGILDLFIGCKHLTKITHKFYKNQ